MKKIFIIISAVFILFLLAAELYVQSEVFVRQIRPFVIGPLKEALGSEAEIGRIRVHFLPLYIEVLDISLLDGKGRQAAAIRKVKVYINPVPLILKKIRLPSIVIVEPRIYAERTKDGRFNFQLLIDRIRSNINRMKTDQAPRFSILLKTIRINQGRLAFKDENSGTQQPLRMLRCVSFLLLTPRLRVC
jgi:uncharacterized protein involved in outer membrane biogenesis